MVYYDDWFIAESLSMPTAIISVYTTEGFVIAADGFDTEADGTINRDSVQKIFDIQSPNPRRSVACAFSGTDRICRKGSTEVVFDFIEAAIAASESLKNICFEKSGDYANALLGKLWPLSDAAIQALSTHTLVLPPTMIYIDGYHAGEARREIVKICHDGKTAPDLMTGWATAGGVMGTSPESIRAIVGGGRDERLAAYRYKLKGIETMPEAISAAWTLIYALCDPEARAIDSRCNAIGGWIHMATLTPSHGFQWLKKPIQVE